MSITVALQGVLFPLDDEAAALLTRYLSDVKLHLAGHAERDDIVGDIENRLAERLSQKLDTKKAITTKDVEAILADMGDAQAFADLDAPTYPAAKPKQLYRDLENGVLAGVCSGLAQYFDVDVSVVRILTVVLALATGVVLPAYLIMWLVIPTAQTSHTVSNPPRSLRNVLLLLIGIPLVILATLALGLLSLLTVRSVAGPAFSEYQLYQSSDPEFRFVYPKDTVIDGDIFQLPNTDDGRARTLHITTLPLLDPAVDQTGCILTGTSQDQAIVTTTFSGRSFCVRTIDAVTDHNTMLRTYHYTVPQADKIIDFIFTLELKGDANVYATCAATPTPVCDSLTLSEGEDTQLFNQILMTYR